MVQYDALSRVEGREAHAQLICPQILGRFDCPEGGHLDILSWPRNRRSNHQRHRHPWDGRGRAFARFVVYLLVPAVAGWFSTGPAVGAPSQDLELHRTQRPMAFEANQGQTDPEVKFLARGRGYNLFLTSTQCVLSLQQSDDLLPENNPRHERGQGSRDGLKKRTEGARTRRFALRSRTPSLLAFYPAVW